MACEGENAQVIKIYTIMKERIIQIMKEKYIVLAGRVDCLHERGPK